MVGDISKETKKILVKSATNLVIVSLLIFCSWPSENTLKNIPQENFFMPWLPPLMGFVAAVILILFTTGILTGWIPKRKKKTKQKRIKRFLGEI
ncbi:MAG: hypothetical protein FJZ43_00970 [Candidatus Staskawiczbacteria bacterium]|nr:hypothetical protein [Candidatus Staskawiczbacteria bacterium]